MTLKNESSEGRGHPQSILCLWVPRARGCGHSSPPWQPRNEGGGAAGSSIVLDELSAIPWEFCYLDLPDPQSAECGKWEVSTDLNVHKMSEKMQFLENCTFFF